jgi:hypothetical protein
MIDFLGGRKNVLGYIFIFCTTFLVYQMITDTKPYDFLGIATVIGAMATGLCGVVWGNVQEHKSDNATGVTQKKPE